MMAPAIRKLLNKPEYWNNAYATGYASTTYSADGKLPERTQALIDKMRPKLGGGEIDFMFWWVALGYDTVKVIEHVIKKAGSTDPAAMQKALEETTELKGVYTTYSWSAQDRNGFPDHSILMSTANTFKDGSFKPAP